MNHRNERYLSGRGINVFSVMLILSLLFFFNSSSLYSQGIISRDITDYPQGSISSTCTTSPYTGCVITLLPAKYGESYSFTIPIKSGVLRSDITFNFTQNTVCSEGSISFTSDGKIEIPALSSCRPENSTFIEILLNVTSSDGTKDNQTYLLPILRDPIQVVLVLDKSGSMSLPVPGGTQVRWQVLKNAVELFVQKLEAFRQDMDLIGVTYFSTDVAQPNAPMSDGFISITSDTDPNRSFKIIQTDMATKEPTNRTAMGKGLLDAKAKLNATLPIEYKKTVLLFTDGMQNVNPLVNTDGKTLSPGTFTLNDYSSTNFNNIRYYTISIGDITLIPELLSQMASANRGVSLTTSIGAEEGEILNSFQDQFANMLGGSAQIVSRKTGLLNSSGTSFSFPINGNVSKLYFEFVNPDAAAITIKLEKDGKDLTALAKISNGAFYKTITLSLPISSPDLINTEGDWNLTLSGTSAKKFFLTCLVDDQLVDFSCQPQKTVYTVGETLFFNAKVSFAGKPIAGNGTKVQVLLLKPGEDLGHLLATYNDNRTDTLTDIETGAQIKFQHLIQSNSSFCKELLPEKQVITLSEEANGIFTGNYDNTELTGVYQLIYIVNGEISGYGKFERQKQYSAVFNFGKISPSATEIHAKISSSKDNTGNAATITIKPKNKFGYYLGPGYLSTIKLTLDPKQVIVKSGKDNLDGSYSFYLVNIPPSLKPDVRIDVMGELLYQGKFPTPRIHPWQYLILILLVLTLFLRYIFAHIGKIWLRTLVWVLIISWVTFMILQKFGVIIF